MKSDDFIANKEERRPVVRLPYKVSTGKISQGGVWYTPPLFLTVPRSGTH